MNILTSVEIFKEDDVYTAISPELKVSSCGEKDESLHMQPQNRLYTGKRGKK
jgi:hypothetical protein